MTTRHLASATILLSCLAAVRPAGATHDEPAKAKAMKVPLVTAYAPCTAPNTLTDGPIPALACAPPVRSDALCGFENRGVGKALGVARANGDVRLVFTLQGLGPGCDGRRLCATADVRSTTDRCQGFPCPAVDLVNVTTVSDSNCCTVVGGSCKIRTTVNSEVIGTLEPGETAGLEVLGCGLTRIDGPNLPTGRTFSCGLLAP